MDYQYTIIRRFGIYVNTIDREQLRQWIIDNCPYEFGDLRMPKEYSEKNCIKHAQMHGYTFKSINRTVK